MPDDSGAAPVPAWKHLQGVAEVFPDEDRELAGRDTDVNKTLNRDS